MTVNLSLRPGLAVEVEIPWPRHPRITPGGKISRAKDAGKPIPYLSTNVLRGLEYVGPGAKQNERRFKLGQSHGLKVRWRQAAVDAATAELEGRDDIEQYQLAHEVEAEIQLYRNPANAMDPSALVEGAKPIIDGLVLAGVLAGDKREHISYSRRSRVYPTPLGTQRVVILLRRPA